MGCRAPVEIRASRKGDLNKCSHEHLFPGYLFRYAETRVVRESWAWRHMPVSSGLMKLQQGLRIQQSLRLKFEDKAKLSMQQGLRIQQRLLTQREKLWVLMLKTRTWMVSLGW